MLEILNKCRVHGNVVMLPSGQLDPKLYKEVAAALNGIGGKWDRKRQGFLFDRDPTENLAKIQAGEKVDLKKQYQAFYTPQTLAEQMALSLNMPRTGQIRVLEPSAGEGVLVKAVLAINPDALVDVYEIDMYRRESLEAIPDVTFVGYDFLDNQGPAAGATYDYIIANPPFTKNADIMHVRKMWEHLAPGGRMASIMSNHWQMSANRKESDFREWLEENDAEIYPIPAGTFKESGTNVATCLVILNK